MRDVRAREVAVAGVAARALAGGRDLAGAGQERQRLRLQDDRTPLRSAISYAWPSSPNPVTSVTAFGPTARTSRAASAFRRRIEAIASSSAAGSTSPRLAPCTISPVPSGFVR